MKYLILPLFLTFVVLGYGQTTTEKRVEFDLKDGYSNERVFEFNANGMLIFSKQDKDEAQMSTYRFEKYNTDLVTTQAYGVLLQQNQT